MEIENVVASLHPLERRVLPFLGKIDTLKDLIKETKLKEVEITRALQWLENKKIVTLKEDIREIIQLDKNGIEYLKKGLPEKRMLETIKSREMGLDEARKKSGLNKDEFNVALGVLQKKAAVFITKRNGLKIKILDNGKKLLEGGFLEGVFLERGFPLQAGELTPEERFSYRELKKRKNIIKTVIIKSKTARLTELGQEILKKGIMSGEFIDRLTPEMLKTGQWRRKKFRSYDVAINVPKIFGGKRHFVNQAVDYAKKIWIELGFEEMVGDLVVSGFWNFDALFTAQDHPVREMQDTFYIAKEGKLPEKKLVNKVKKAHESGVHGSRGWQYSWNEKEAKRLLLRTHTTCLSAQTLYMLSKIKEKRGKFFAVGRCFRNETVDWSHGFEFNQTEGIVVDKNVNFRHLLGYLKEFFMKMGFEKIRFAPAYFPYTEPSVEISAWNRERGVWLELGGAGIFRPELVVPLIGEFIPVLAWGPGFDRMIMNYYQIKDLRDMYRNDLTKLRKMKFWIK